jgi:predicted transglutaminase-like cysteine proteinase
MISLSVKFMFIIIFISITVSSRNMFKFDLVALQQTVAAVYGEGASNRLRAWRTLIGDLTGATEDQQLRAVNVFFNQFYFINDNKLWGKNDYWATPVEFIGVNGGDCEDFSIAKYFGLLELGVEPDKLRLVYVKAVTQDQFHMVLAYYATPDSEPLILDNLDKRIKAATARSDLQPIYSFNGTHLWLMKEKGRGQLAGQSSSLKRWVDVQSRFDLNALQQPLIDLGS